MVGHKKERILVVEDEALVARELKSRLIQMGWEVAGIAYGEEAIELARETRPDLLLTDIHLKNGIDGIEVSRKICEEMDIPVVFLTAYSDADTVARAKAVTPFGYIIKPVENRELQITIDIALYKFQIDKELRDTQQLLQTALTCIGSALLFVDEAGKITNANKEAHVLLAEEDCVGVSWRRLLGQKNDSSIVSMVNTALKEKGIARLPPFVVEVADNKMKMVDGIVGPMDSGGVLILRELAEINDAIEMLAPPGEVLASLGPDILSPSESSFCQILVSTHSRLGSAETDKIIERLSRKISKFVRSTDLVSIFGGSILSVSMPYTSIVEGEHIARTLLRQVNNELPRSERYQFSIGLAHSTAGDRQPIELFRRAKLALTKAQSRDDDKVVIWTEDFERSANDRSNEIHLEREYHNLVQLWNIMNVLSQAESLEMLARGFCEHMFQFFRFERISLLEIGNGSLSSITGFTREDGEIADVSELRLTAADFQLVENLLPDGSGDARHDGTWVFGLGAARVLLLDYDESIDKTQTEFIRTLATYFSTGITRFELPQEAEQINETAASDALIYRSPQIESIIESIKLVAPTDATVLITGESGTGKELFAKHLHKMSQRNDEAFIIVDCGAIVGSLIESELFGHVKGAFTGADRDSKGRLKEADGGTVLLDEVGELPIDVQVKLLRFVQDRQIAAVGSSTYQNVDTRVIAATNKDLKQMVADGAFREDLYYRLNVFAIKTPGLRERTADILPLANHYLSFYAAKYGKKGLSFSPEADRALLHYHWPGNIRELVNVVNRSVILCKDLRVNPIHLGLFSENVEQLVPKSVGNVSLQQRFSDLISRSHRLKPDLPPIGQWIEEDLIVTSMNDHGRILNRAASALGVPESTLRRKVKHLREIHWEEPPERPGGWIDVRVFLEELDQITKKTRIPVLDIVSQTLAREIEKQNIARQDAARLMGVSIPTYRKLVGSLDHPGF
jgi:DNA-binding NtrC family response regulator